MLRTDTQYFTIAKYLLTIFLFFSVRQKLTIRLKSYEGELKRLENEFVATKENTQQIQSRHQLLGAATIDMGESGNPLISTL